VSDNSLIVGSGDEPVKIAKELYDHLEIQQQLVIHHG
jgi:hypothetical protein